MKTVLSTSAYPFFKDNIHKDCVLLILKAFAYSIIFPEEIFPFSGTSISQHWQNGCLNECFLNNFKDPDLSILSQFEERYFS